MRRRYVCLLALAATYLFFHAYLSPFRKVHIPFDLDGYHYPLADYAFQELRQGRFPLWDAAIYCGQTFAGNVQAALFYPGTWLMFAANWFRSRLTYQGMQMFEIAHVWLAVVFCYFWFARRLHPLASALAASVFAFSGYTCLQLQHMGLVVGFAWYPLAFWGIDEYAESGNWRKLWKPAVASAMIFLAGYPPMWAVFASCAAAYAAVRRRLLGVGAALAFSFGLCAVQLLPAMEATHWMIIEPRYGLGIKDPAFFLSYFVPNFFDFGLDRPVELNFGKEYLYLGSAGLLGLGCWVVSRRWKEGAPFLAALAVSLVGLLNPFNVVWATVQHSEMLASVLRSWYFLAGVTFALSGIAALGLDWLLRHDFKRAWPRFWGTDWGLVGAFGAWLYWVPKFPAGWWTALYAAFGVFLLGTALRGRRGKAAWTALVFSGLELAAYGTQKRFNADKGPTMQFTDTFFPGMHDDSYRLLRENVAYRVAVDDNMFGAVMLRHVGLTTPGGFDPFLSRQFHDVVASRIPFRTDREFEIPPERTDLFDRFGVRYYISSPSSAHFAALKASPDFRQVGGDAYYKLFEYARAKRPFRWNGQADIARWNPENRELKIQSPTGGPFLLVEQFFPGWRAFVDGRETSINLADGAFQSIDVPPGEHSVRFEYSSPSVRNGAILSALSWAALAALLLRKPK